MEREWWISNGRIRIIGVAVAALFTVMAAQVSLLVLRMVGAAQANSVAVGLVPEVGGVVDMPFNSMAYQGLLRAQDELGVAGTVYTPTSESQYQAKLQQCVGDGNDLCITVGFGMANATLSEAAAHSGTDFAIVDFSWGSYPDNLRGMIFASDEVGYLAGSLAGMMTVSDVIGTVGGMPIPPVDDFIDAYKNAAQCVNPDVTVLISYTLTFTDSDLGAQIAQEMITADADVIFGVGGAAGNGAILTATQSGVWGIGVDTDQWVTVFMSGAVSGSDKLLTSARKRVDNAVYDAISDEVSGMFTSGTVRFDLSMDGVGLAPYHETDASVPSNVRGTLERVERGIIWGVIDPLTDACQKYQFVPLAMRGY